MCALFYLGILDFIVHSVQCRMLVDCIFVYCFGRWPVFNLSMHLSVRRMTWILDYI